MLALDQRESLRTMLAAERASHAATPTDAELTAFKVAAARILTPLASAVLLDVDHGLRPAVDAGAIAAGCGLIVAADRLVQAPGGPVEDTGLHPLVMGDDAVAAIADAYKLLVIWRPDRGHAQRKATVHRFVEACRERGRPSIVEGIVRPSEGASPYEPLAHADAVLAAAEELTSLEPDLYKAEVPTQGRLDDDAIVRASRRLSAAVASPWVVLSNGVDGHRFPSAALAAARGGASGFLAGRAIWSASLRARNVEDDLAMAAAARLRDLALAMDSVARPWPAALAVSR
jgi:sulfofructosephosphate aldolase